MLRNRNQLAEDYFNGSFRYSDSIAESISPDRFAAINHQFSLKYDDFYHAYFIKQGDAVKANKALIRMAFALFQAAHGHLPLAYKNCAISSGTWAHLDAVTRNHHTTDRLSRVVVGDWHGRTIKDNSQRSLERIERIRDLFIEVFFIAPTMFEGSTRAFSKGFGRHLTSVPFQAEEYMAFWNMVIDQCKAFVLDDIRLDMPSIERVEHEIDLAKSYSSQSRARPILRTSDWANSRNSIYEMARGNYIRFGVHPLRPDAVMDMRIYDEATRRLYPARLIDTLKPVLQSILRWGPQGIAVDSACTTAARLIDLHRQRTDTVYNRFQAAPLQLDTLSPLVGKPSVSECREFDRLIELFEPILLEYFPHLMNTDGLPVDYRLAKQKHPLTSSGFGEKTVRWQRDNIPKQKILDLWEYTLPTDFNPRKACKVTPVSHGIYTPQRRLHDFERQPFEIQADEIWPDNPYEFLGPMFKQLAKSHIGVLEIVAQNSDKPEYKGIFFDLKRGEVALDTAARIGLADISLLPGALGASFADEVRSKNMARAAASLTAVQNEVKGARKHPVLAFGTPIIAAINTVINTERQFLNGPGPNAVPSDYRLALSIEMLRRNLTEVRFSKNWEISEDEVRLMMMATKIELGHVKRPGNNHTELKVFDEDGQPISFSERIIRLHTYLSRLKSDPNIKRSLEARDANAVEGYGIRYLSLTLARMMEVYDSFIDQEFNKGRFETRKLENLESFTQGMEHISDLRNKILHELQQEWCWLWQEKDLGDLRQDYREHWLAVQGIQAQQAGVTPHFAEGVRHAYGPR
jgi:hypothetical protein